MKTIEEINDIINRYNDLVKLAEEKIDLIESIDSKYNTERGIESIDFNNHSVYVLCDDSWGGCHESFSFMFPIDWLSKSNEELKKIVEHEKELRIKKEQEEKDAIKLKEKIDKENKEKALYLKLKDKFEK